VRNYILVCLFLFFVTNTFFCQKQKKVDSLITVFGHNKNSDESTKAKLLYSITINSSIPEEKLAYANLLLKNSKKYKPNYYKVQAYNFKGVAYRLKGDLKSSFKNLFKSAKLAFENNMPIFEAEAYSEISNTYAINKDFSNSLLYQNKAISIFRKHASKNQLAIALLNTGFDHYSYKKYDDALELYNEAEPLFEEINIPIGKAYIIGNRALVYWKIGKIDKAKKDLLSAINALKAIGDNYGIADYHNQLGTIYLETGNIERAIFHVNESLSIAKSSNLKVQLRDALLLLSSLHQKQGKHKEALAYYKQYDTYKDSIENKEQTKKIADLRTDYEVNLREKEIDLLEKKEKLNITYSIIGLVFLVLAIITLLYFRQRFKTTKLLATQQEKEHHDSVQNLLKSQETKVLQSMILAKDNERKRLAKDLHNHLGSLLATVKVNINGIDEKTIPNHKTLINLVDQACTDVRNISHSLNMGVSEDFGLLPALKELINHLKESKKLEVEFNASIDENVISSEDEIIIYRTIQELISNVLKHAKASKLSILLTYFQEENIINILIQDDGVGFNAGKEFDGLGLKSIKDIVLNYEGEITFDSNSNSGTTVNIDLPLKDSNTL
jgi:signal transduction histidine kinase